MKAEPAAPKKYENKHLPPLLAASANSVASSASPTVPENSIITPLPEESESCPPLLAPAEHPVPEKEYPNSDTCKSQILSDNKNQSGIYMWENKINAKRYIGSSVDLSNRLSNYYSTAYMEDALKRGISHIYRALLKNDYSNFSLTILEYCEPDKCLIREKHYWDILKPEYNIAKEPGAPMSGRKHSDKTKKILLETENYGRFKTGHKHSNETKTKISDTLTGHTGAAQPTSQKKNRSFG